MTDECRHPDFTASVRVNLLTDVGPFIACVRIECAACGTPFRFIGLPLDIDFNGASVSVDGREGHFTIAPKGEVLSALDGTASGFTVRKSRADEGK